MSSLMILNCSDSSTPPEATCTSKRCRADYLSDGLRFQKFAFEGTGEIDFIVAGALTKAPFKVQDVEGRTVRIETLPEIIAKKVYHRGSEAKPRDIFDIAAAARSRLGPVVNALSAFPEQVARTRERLEKLNPEFVRRAIAQLIEAAS